VSRQVQVTDKPKQAPTVYPPFALTWPEQLRRTIPQALLEQLEQQVRLVFQIAWERDWHRHARALGSGRSHHDCSCDDTSPPCPHGATAPGALPAKSGSSDPTEVILAKLYEMPERTRDGRIIHVVVTSDEIDRQDTRYLHALVERVRRANDKVRWERGDPTAPEPERGPGRHRVLVSDPVAQ
jgi:hypothetical protein